MARKAYLLLFMLVLVTVLTHCFGQETKIKLEPVKNEAEAVTASSEFVLEPPSVHFRGYELSVMSDMALGISGLQCPTANNSTIRAMKLYIRDREKEITDMTSTVPDPNFLPFFSKFVRCYSRLITAKEEASRPKVTVTTTTTAPSTESPPKKTTALPKVKVTTSKPEETYSIWSTIQRAITNFSRYLVIRHKRSVEEEAKPEQPEAKLEPEAKSEPEPKPEAKSEPEPNPEPKPKISESEPKKVENLMTILKVTEAPEQKNKLPSLPKTKKDIQEILQLMTGIASNSCLAEAKELAQFFEKGMKEVLYWVSTDERLEAATKEFDTETLLDSIKKCSSKMVVSNEEIIVG